MRILKIFYGAIGLALLAAVFAQVDEREPTAPALLKRMGFMPVHDNVVMRMPA